jgi:hypothetical protein
MSVSHPSEKLGESGCWQSAWTVLFYCRRVQASLNGPADRLYRAASPIFMMRSSKRVLADKL